MDIDREAWYKEAMQIMDDGEDQMIGTSSRIYQRKLQAAGIPWDLSKPQEEPLSPEEQRKRDFETFRKMVLGRAFPMLFQSYKDLEAVTGKPDFRGLSMEAQELYKKTEELLQEIAMELEKRHE